MRCGVVLLCVAPRCVALRVALRCACQPVSKPPPWGAGVWSCLVIYTRTASQLKPPGSGADAKPGSHHGGETVKAAQTVTLPPDSLVARPPPLEQLCACFRPLRSPCLTWTHMALHCHQASCSGPCAVAGSRHYADARTSGRQCAAGSCHGTRQIMQWMVRHTHAP